MSTNQFRRYLDLLNEADDIVPPNTTVALPSAGSSFSNDQALANALAQQGEEPRCAFCGTPQSQHQALRHQFVAGGDAARPAAVTAPGADSERVMQLQAELKAAGANLGATGANRDGIDGDMGPLTAAAMAKYPQIAAKYADVSGAPAQAATPAVDTSKLNAALTAIETIVAKYKGKAKVSESRIYEADRPLSAKEYQARIAQTIPPDVTAPADTAGFQQSKIQKGGYVPPAPAAPTQSVYDRFNKPSPAPTGVAKAMELKPSSWASKVGQKILARLPGLGARTAAKAGATVASGPLAPIVGAVSTAYTIWDIGSMLYDVYKDSKNLEGMNDADQAVVKQNLAVVMSFMKDPKIADTLPPDIHARVENAMTDLNTLAVDTGYGTPAKPVATTAVPQQAATPAVAAAPNINATADKIDTLLKKYNFESRQPRTLSEQMARDRDIVNEGVASTVGKYAWKAVEPIVKTAVQGAAVGGIGAAGYGGYKAWKSLTAPAPLNAADKIEFERLVAELQKLVPDEDAYNNLSPDMKKKIDQILDRATQAKNATPGTK